MSWFSKIFKRSKVVVENPKPAGPDLFDVAIEVVLGAEGGLSNHAADRGGLTNFGVTQKTYNAWRLKSGLDPQSVRDITRAEVRSIYREFWIDSKAYTLPKRAAIAVFDMAINSGAGRALRYWNLAEGNLDAFLRLREEFYRGIVAKNPSQKVFLNGWLNRLKHLKETLGGLHD